MADGAPPPDPVPAHHASPAVAFVIGLSIVLLASILNAGGLNLTKLDHVRTSAVPKAARKKDWARPLWLVGMLLYILSQLIGSTLALEYLRAEYVAPLGSTSLIFNFLFASMLVGTPVTSTDIYGTIIVILGVVGIVAFGSINAGLAAGMDIARLSALWGRAHWLAYFAAMALALALLFLFAAQLERILAARADVAAEPFAGQARRGAAGGSAAAAAAAGWRARVLRGHARAMDWVAEKIEVWTAAKDDKTIAWTLGIGWACCGGGLAGGCLVFARTSVKLISGTLAHENTGNQFAHAAAVATFVFLGATAALQILCLNRALKAYDSTLVVPVFYGVYTGTGFLDALVFNDEVDAYRPWTLVLIFTSVLVLIAGVVLLTHKKPDAKAGAGAGAGVALTALPAPRRAKGAGKGARGDDDGAADEGAALHAPEAHRAADPAVWELGDASDDDATLAGSRDSDGDSAGAEDGPATPAPAAGAGRRVGLVGSTPGEEGRGLMARGEDERELDEW
ncbi:hypothetical protein DFH11DRAFT_1838856 [Phellopilus nigrolimitatus]|nr:hypothetical protein DFH11DRAFT_1838856 [Phellopilus nigrolimitatus]